MSRGRGWRTRITRLVWMALVAAGTLSFTSNAGGIAVQRADGGLVVTGAHYRAFVAADGCLTSLRVDGVEMLRAGVGPSRGGYLGQDGRAVALDHLSRRGDKVVMARGAAGSVRYDFGAQHIGITASNQTARLMHHFLVLDARVDAAAGPREKVLATPFRRDWHSTTWFRDSVRLRVDGADVVWGPWEAGTELSEVALAPGQQRTIWLEPGPSSAAELQRLVAAGLRGDRKLRAIRGRFFRATVGDDGALCSLRVRNRELLDANVGISRGGYLAQDGPVPLPRVEQPSSDLITAAGDRASVRFEGGRDDLVWTVNNLSAAPMSVFLVLDPQFDAVANQQCQVAKVPCDRSWPVTTWFCRGVKVRIYGGQWIFGPWHRRQVWQAMLRPGEQRSVRFEFGTAGEVDRERLEWLPIMAGLEAEGLPKPSALTVTAPRRWQVFQRRSERQGSIVVRGNVQPNADWLMVRVRGKSLGGPLPDHWQSVPVFGTTHAFDARLEVPAGGWYDVDLRALRGDKLVAKCCVEKVGVGEVFVGAGQSNSTNSGEVRIQQTTGLVGSFSGGHWESGSDPQPGVHDGSRGGSFWPVFGDALAEHYRVPIGLAVTGHEGTSVFQWQRPGTLYRWLMARCDELGPGGFRALLWHQGEADGGVGGETYYNGLRALIEWSRYDAGWRFPWFVAQASYHNSTEPSFADVRAGQAKAWATGLALPGPDTDKLGPQYRDPFGPGTHFNLTGQRAHGRLWAAKLKAYIDRHMND